MGLDMVEFVMEVEETFELTMPDHVFQELTTPRRLIDYLHSQLPHTDERHCLTQRAFYVLVCTIQQELGPIQPRLRPRTEIAGILPGEDPSAAWRRVGAALECARWPKHRGSRWWSALDFGARPRTIGEAARHMAITEPLRLKLDGEGWSWDEVRVIVDGLIRSNLGVTKYSLDDEFVRDMDVG